MKRIILISFLSGLFTGFLQAQDQQNKSQIAFRNNTVPEDWQPLIVVDDVVYSDSIYTAPKKSLSIRLANIDLESVESISVLKPDSALVLYGDKARYGVVIITTKKTPWWQKSKTTK